MTDEEIIEERKPSEKNYQDLVSCYLGLLTSIPIDPYHEFLVEKRLVRIGKELLSKDGQNNIYKNASECEKDARPAEKKTELTYRKFGNDTRTIYTITADDAGVTHAESERLDIMLKNFENQQYGNASSELSDINSQILHVLVEQKIIPILKPTIQDIIDKEIKEIYEKGLSE